MIRASRWLIVIAHLLILTACSRAGSPAAPATLPAPDSLRTLRSGAVIGSVNDAGGHSWLGIPYAAPPVGPLRWRPPQPVAPWPATRVTRTPGSPCVQFGWALGGVGEDGTRQGSENCLYLNVYAPRLAPTTLSARRLPVMVWIHGGSNTVGHAAFYDGSRLAVKQNVIVVMINYRLGPFGWFVLPGTRDPVTDQPLVDPLEASGNWGILDAVSALRWVQDNAAAFGGDPDNVTVFGESAGGTNILALLVSPLSTGLFHRAIVQSLGFGFAPLPRVSHYADAPAPGDAYSSSEVLLKLLVGQGLAADRASARARAATMSAAQIAAFLRGLDPWTVYAAYESDSIGADRLPTVFQDGAVVRDGQLDSLLADPATHLNVPTLFGTNRDEPKLFMAFDRKLVFTVAGLPAWPRDAAAYEREATYRAQLWKADGVDKPVSLLARHPAPTYAYRWDWREQGRRFGVVNVSQLVGAAHGLEIPFVFGTFDTRGQGSMLYSKENEPARERLSAQMMSYWGEFARTGQPGRGHDGTLPEWLPWHAQNDGQSDGQKNGQNTGWNIGQNIGQKFGQTNGPGEGGGTLILDTDAGGGVRMSSGLVTRDSVLAAIDREPLPERSRCELFRATFRSRHDSWADEAWGRVSGGRCPAVLGPQRWQPER